MGLISKCNTCGEEFRTAIPSTIRAQFCPFCGFSSKYEPEGDIVHLSRAAKRLRESRDHYYNEFTRLQIKENTEFDQLSQKITALEEARDQWRNRCLRRERDRATSTEELKAASACIGMMSWMLKAITDKAQQLQAEKDALVTANKVLLDVIKKQGGVQ